MIAELTNDEIEEVLKRNVLGRIGCWADNKIYIVPVNYVYDGKHLLAHSKEGLKIFMMRKTPDVCFEVDEMQNFTNWRSVILWGVYQELTDERSRYAAMKFFTEKMMQAKISSTAKAPHHAHEYASSKTVIYRIVITEKSGRFEKD